MQQQVKDTIDREGEAGIPDLVETANELAGTGVAGYIQAEADNYVSYKKEQTGKDK